jgi:hypothetical protein
LADIFSGQKEKEMKRAFLSLLILPIKQNSEFTMLLISSIHLLTDETNQSEKILVGTLVTESQQFSFNDLIYSMHK